MIRDSYHCTLGLQPLVWRQSVAHWSSDIDVEGRHLAADCAVADTSGLRLNNKMRLKELPVRIDLFETTRMNAKLSKLPQGALGSFSFHSETPADVNIPGIEAFLSGWFVLNAQSLEDVWNQVQQGGYSECTFQLGIGPVKWIQLGLGPVAPTWDVVNSPVLIIDTVSVSFHRAASRLDKPEEHKLDKPEEHKRTSFWRR